MYSNLSFFKSTEISHRTGLLPCHRSPLFLSVAGMKNKIEWGSEVILSKLVGVVFLLTLEYCE